MRVIKTVASLKKNQIKSVKSELDTYPVITSVESPSEVINYLPLLPLLENTFIEKTIN